jgi:mercuric ion transport protein
VFTSLGLGFLLDVRWLFPMTAVFLFIAVATLGFRARRRRGHGPFLVGLGASALVLGGKFGLGTDAAMYAGLPLLIGASIWNTWPKPTTPACQACRSI